MNGEAEHDVKNLEQIEEGLKDLSKRLNEGVNSMIKITQLLKKHIKKVNGYES